MIIITSFRVILCFLCTLPSVAFAYNEKQDVAQEESRTVNTFATRSDDGQRAQVVTGTFRFVFLLWIHEFMIVIFSLRFRRVVNRDANIVSGKPSGWDIEGMNTIRVLINRLICWIGCYCAAGNRCSCTGNRNRVKMVRSHRKDYAVSSFQANCVCVSVCKNRISFQIRISG